MKINIASFGGRSHLLDTARELEKYGHEVRFYSYLPNRRSILFGLKKECNYSMYYLAIPFLGLFKTCNILGLRKTKRYLYYVYKRIFDYLTAFYMKPCDVFIGQSPMHTYSLKYAKRRYNAITILERGTSHVIEQAKALDTNPSLKGKTSMPSPYLNYDLKGYSLADYISVGSAHVKASFLKHGFNQNKIFVNNYGFDLNQFKPTILSSDSYDIIFVGQWSHRKGVDLLIEVCKRTNYKFLHVGNIVDVEFPELDNMTHQNAVPQHKLIEFYSKAKVFVLPSREEGLALVQAQAVACGLPIVCSKFTGGRDLRAYIDSDEWIIEMENLDVENLLQCIEKALQLSFTQTSERNYINENFNEISWEGYGRRYDKFIKKIVS